MGDKDKIQGFNITGISWTKNDIPIDLKDIEVVNDVNFTTSPNGIEDEHDIIKPYDKSFTLSYEVEIQDKWKLSKLLKCKIPRKKKKKLKKQIAKQYNLPIKKVKFASWLQFIHD